MFIGLRFQILGFRRLAFAPSPLQAWSVGQLRIQLQRSVARRRHFPTALSGSTKTRGREIAYQQPYRKCDDWARRRRLDARTEEHQHHEDWRERFENLRVNPSVNALEHLRVNTSVNALSTAREHEL